MYVFVTGYVYAFFRQEAISGEIEKGVKKQNSIQRPELKIFLLICFSQKSLGL